VPNIIFGDELNDAERFFTEKLRFEADPATVNHMIESKNQDIVVVDVRGRNAYKDGHVPKAISMPNEELDSRIGELPKNKRIILYCYNIACFRAPQAALKLAQHGYDNVTEMIGGFDEWQKHGHPVEK
jgi:rhodanese-related sulfurtransferase